MHTPKKIFFFYRLNHIAFILIPFWKSDFRNYDGCWKVLSNYIPYVFLYKLFYMYNHATYFLLKFRVSFPLIYPRISGGLWLAFKSATFMALTFTFCCYRYFLRQIFALFNGRNSIETGEDFFLKNSGNKIA